MRAGGGQWRGRIAASVFAAPVRVGASVLLLVLALVLLGCGQTADAPPAAVQTAASGTTSTLGDPAGSPSTIQPPVAGVAATVPRTIAGLSLSEYLDGEQAIIQVEQLHGKGLGAGLDEAWLATYGTGGAATLWVSRSVRLQDAEALMERMKTKIAAGTSPFTHPQTMTAQGVEVQALDGMGQKHYYFRVGRDLYWLAIEPGLGDAGLRELVESGLQAAKAD